MLNIISGQIYILNSIFASHFTNSTLAKLTVAAFSVSFSQKEKRYVENFEYKHNCVLQVFPLKGVKCRRLILVKS